MSSPNSPLSVDESGDDAGAAISDDSAVDNDGEIRSDADTSAALLFPANMISDEEKGVGITDCNDPIVIAPCKIDVDGHGMVWARVIGVGTDVAVGLSSGPEESMVISTKFSSSLLST